ncbi:DUF2242 domain-containing protein [Undibacterium sp. Ren11W]|uniref:DUF2242 domain-containing protein n=1 Tax=Undibacterium sp. Ren11W TaxID=3413045 RepID=UPI003BF1C302
MYSFLGNGTRRVAMAVATIALLSGCAGNKSVTLQQEEFGASNVFSNTFAGSETAACEAARRALLSQGYVIYDAKSSYIKGRRKFQRDSDVHVEIDFTVVCAKDGKGSNSSSVFANAVLDRYTLKKSSNASLGVGGFGSVSLPFGASDDALVKVSSETVATGKFYQRFFELLERYMDDSSIDSDESETMKKDLATSANPIVKKPDSKTEQN